MRIAGFQEASTVDYPGEVASVIFTYGCNLKCPYCYNHEIAQDFASESKYSNDEIIDKLKANKIITAVVITGGEPTIQPDLIDFMRRIKNETGLKIKLFTNGLNYVDVLRAIPYIDALSIDYKTMPHMYRYLGASHNQIEAFKNLVTELRYWNIQLEYRCTLAPFLTDEKIVETIRNRVSPAKLITQECIMTNIMDPSFFQDHK